MRMRELMASNKVLAQPLEKLEREVTTHNEAIIGILKTIREVTNQPVTKSRPIGCLANLDEKRQRV